MTTSPSGYGLPSSEAERDRLRWQAQRREKDTEELLAGMGIGEGWRVLDVGTGLGDVACIAARLVGPTGYVLGIDSDPAQVEHARRSAAEQGLAHVEFAVADLHAIPAPRQPFDAVVGRFVLTWQTDPAAALRAVSAHVRAGGVIGFMEGSLPPLSLANAEDLWCIWPPVPAVNKLLRVLFAMPVTVGAQPMMGHRLLGAFLEAGLPGPVVDHLLPPLWIGGDGLRQLFPMARSFWPRALELGLVDNPDVEAFEREVMALPEIEHLVFTLPSQSLTAWARKP